MTRFWAYVGMIAIWFTASVSIQNAQAANSAVKCPVNPCSLCGKKEDVIAPHVTPGSSEDNALMAKASTYCKLTRKIEQTRDGDQTGWGSPYDIAVIKGCVADLSACAAGKVTWTSNWDCDGKSASQCEKFSADAMNTQLKCGMTKINCGAPSNGWSSCSGESESCKPYMGGKCTDRIRLDHPQKLGHISRYDMCGDTDTPAPGSNDGPAGKSVDSAQ